MHLSSEAIKEFKALYQKKFGEVLSDEEVIKKGTALAILIQQIYKPIPKQKHNSQ